MSIFNEGVNVFSLCLLLALLIHLGHLGHEYVQLGVSRLSLHLLLVLQVLESLLRRILLLLQLLHVYLSLGLVVVESPWNRFGSLLFLRLLKGHVSTLASDLSIVILLLNLELP